MPYDQYEPVIGLEVHCQLQTASKAFSPDAAAYGAEPNTQVGPVSLGHPGTLPVLNEAVIEYALRMGLATHCQIAPHVTFARKHYVYPDLPKGYQITQHGTPICYDGYVEFLLADGDDPAGGNPARSAQAGDGAAARRTKRVGLTRIHIEEDAGKLVHDAEAGTTRVDYNRCGVPLLEIVTEPDLRAPHEAYLFLQKIRQLVRYLGICDGRMEHGSLRCDANVSVRPRGRPALGVRTEIKNLNSARAVEQALEYEVARHMALAERGEAVAPETRRWEAGALETRPLRAKEAAPDYRYLPDPDLAQIPVSRALLRKAQAALPEMPDTRQQRFMEDLRLSARDAALLTEERALADYFENTLAALYKHTKGGNTQAQAKMVANVIMTDVLRARNEHALGIREFPVEPDRLAALVYLRLEDELSSSAAQEVFRAMLDSEEDPAAIADARGLRQVSDEEALRPVIDEVLERHTKNVKRYRSGKKSLIGFFVGQTMSHFDDDDSSDGAPDPQAVRRLLEKRLSRRG